MTSSTPSLQVQAGGGWISAAAEGEPVPVRGVGDLRVRSAGHPPNAEVTLHIGERVVELMSDAEGALDWSMRGLLGTVAGRVRIAVDGAALTLLVRPEKLTNDALAALVGDLEAIAEGLAQDAGAVATLGLHRSREGDLAGLDQAVGLAGSAAASIRRRPIHRARERVRAVPREGGARSAADARWLATHPVAAARAAATGRAVGVHRERRADLDTLENRGVLSTYDRLDDATHRMEQLVQAELDRLAAARPAREAFLTEAGSLWSERDAPRVEALERRLARIEGLGAEVAEARTRSGLPDLRPRSARMVRTPRVDAEPAYWTTFRAFLLAERSLAGRTSPVPAAVGSLDELWEQWCTIVVVAELTSALGASPRSLVQGEWFATLKRGEIAAWQARDRGIRLLYEPEYGFEVGAVRKLFPGRPWRPDLVIETTWADGTIDLHILDAKFRIGEGGHPPMDALQELWWRYGEGIGTERRLPVVRSLWVLWPGERMKLVGPGMLHAGWELDRLRGGAIGLWPGAPRTELGRVLQVILGT